jgi:hypothetical protein
MCLRGGFTWINAFSVIGLIATGLVILNDDPLGLSSGGKILLKGVHVSLGYAMAANLVWPPFGPSSATGIRVGGVSCRAARDI